MLFIIALRNWIELSSASSTFSIFSFLPSSFSLPSLALLQKVFSPAIIVLLSECLVDWLKHAFITKFNHIRPAVYARYIDVLCKDLVVGAGRRQDQVNPSSLPSLLSPFRSPPFRDSPSSTSPHSSPADWGSPPSPSVASSCASSSKPSPCSPTTRTPTRASTASQVEVSGRSRRRSPPGVRGSGPFQGGPSSDWSPSSGGCGESSVSSSSCLLS